MWDFCWYVGSFVGDSWFDDGLEVFVISLWLVRKFVRCVR